MSLSLIPFHSLRTRIVLLTLTIFVISTWGLSLYTSQTLRKDMERLLGEQQFSAVSLLATQVNREILDRLNALEGAANSIHPEIATHAASMQAYLDQRPYFKDLFNDGVRVYQTDGTSIVASPLAPERVGGNYLDRDYVIGPIKYGKTTIGQPVMGRAAKAPVVIMAVPIRDRQGKVIGALSGITNLGKPNFLDKITENRYGKTGGYSLISSQHRLIVTATEKSRIMNPLQALGMNPAVDRYAQGYEGSAVYVNTRGVEVLSSAAMVPAAGWFVLATLPTADAFSPIRDMQRRMLLATILLTLVAGGLSWMLLRHQLSPLSTTAKALATFSDTSRMPQPLPIIRQDEIGQLISGFNHLLGMLWKREEALRMSENQFRDIFNNAPIGYHEYNSEGIIIRVNQTELAMLGYSEEEMLGHYLWEFVDDSVLSKQRAMDKLAGVIPPNVNLERMHCKKDGSKIPTLIHDFYCRDREGKITSIRTTLVDITERKLIEKNLSDSENRFRIISSITSDILYSCLRSDDGIFRVNWMSGDTEKLFGCSAEEIMSQGCWRPFVVAEDLPLFESAITDIQPGQTGDTILRIMQPDGTLRHVHSISRVEIDFSGQDCHILYGALQDITDRKQSEEMINHLAFFDHLTGLPNRTLLQDRLKQAMASSLRSGRHGALLLIDLDHFKTLNDTLGHDMGDLLLKQVALRLTDCVREEDTVARQGGDEFVVMLVSLSENQIEAASLVELIGGKIIAALNQPFALKDVAYRTTPSIGASVFVGQQTEIDTLLKQADLAMYKAKDAGRNTLRFFDPDMAQDVLKRAALDNDLRDALQKEQFVLHYQPQMTGNQVTGAEALLRWERPGRGLVFPGEFIAAIEETGLILPVGQWVLEKACKQLAEWATQVDKSHLTLAVNISARQLNDEGFVDQVLMTLDRSGANPGRLKLELTESLLVNNVEEIIDKMTVLKAMGVGFSLDDFGTGYSSLTYLKRLPLDQLKIDQSFVRDILTDPNDMAIARMIVVLADSLGLGVIAEGVEMEAQREALTQQGCHAYQGYLFSRPLPLNQFESYIKRV